MTKPRITNYTLTFLKSMIATECKDGYDMGDGYVNPNLIFSSLVTIIRTKYIMVTATLLVIWQS